MNGSSNTTNNNKTQTTKTIRSKTHIYSHKFKEYLNTHLSPHALYDQLQQPEYKNNNVRVSELEKKYQQIHKKLIQMEQKNKSLQHQNKELKLENNKLKTVVRGLTQFVKTGPKPQYNAVPMMKKENCSWSKRINKLKQHIYLKQLHANAIDADKCKKKSLCIEIQESELKIENEWICHDALRQNINKYMELNGLNNSNPLIILSESKNDIEMTDKINRLDVLETFIIKPGHRISSLVGELGVRSNKFIAKGTVLGQYTGSEYLSEEFEEIYCGSMEYDTRSIYSFELNVNIPNCNGNGNDNECYKMVIDAWDERKKNALIYVNDCRKDINVNIPTNEDNKYWNCSFKNVYIDGWPCVFIIAKRDIKVGEELNLFYGAKYGESIKLKDNYQTLMARITGLIDDAILKMLGMDVEISDVYILDI